MQTHFSILSASIRPEIQEQVAIGLLLVGSNSVFFQTAKQKLAVVKELVPQQTSKYLKETLTQITQASIKENERLKGFFGTSDIISKPFSSGYLEYLSRYSNNLLVFSNPKTIELEANEVLFEMLFKKYIDESGFIQKSSEPRSFDSFRNLFFPKVKSYFNIEQEITSEDVPDLVISLKVDLIGKNEIPVYAQTIDLERLNYHIQNDLAVILMLNRAFVNAKGFLVSSEPDKILFSHQHETWKTIKAWKESEYVDLSEYERIEEYATEHGVLPFVK
jgi:hypothetical protein